MRIPLTSFLTYYVVCFIPTYVSSSPRCLSMPTQDDDCDNRLDDWYFDKNEGKCVNFMYGDCPQNNNIFQSQEECETTCKGAAKGHQATEPGGWGTTGSKGHRKPPKAPRPSQQTIGGGAKRPGKGGNKKSQKRKCFSKPRKGKCDNGDAMWYYNSQFYQCDIIPQGFCPGNAPFFESCEECAETCNKRSLKRCNMV
ncbi:doenitin-1-like isoform X1 [Dermacentor andersoni]|uniref:doenitin-1-like isoform X1 n=2 Tax=Dermacentor andersoni TaxID=34620 RepID=UPI003B3B68E5